MALLYQKKNIIGKNFRSAYFLFKYKYTMKNRVAIDHPVLKTKNIFLIVMKYLEHKERKTTRLIHYPVDTLL